MAKLQLVDANDDIVDDPTEAQLDKSLANMNQRYPFVILSRSDREPADQHYIQVYLHEDGSYQIEYREGSADKHFGATHPPVPDVVSMSWLVNIMLDWAQDGPHWREALPWQPTQL